MFGSLLGLRREVGVIGGVLTLVHVVWSVKLHARWQWALFFFNAKGNRIAEVNYRVDGIANWLGLVAVLLLAPILLSSNSWVERFLGAPGWKWLQSHTYTFFYLLRPRRVSHLDLSAGVGQRRRACPRLLVLVLADRWQRVGLAGARLRRYDRASPGRRAGVQRDAGGREPAGSE